MIKILHDLRYENWRNYGSLVYTGSCRISINSRTILYGPLRAPVPGRSGLAEPRSHGGLYRVPKGSEDSYFKVFRPKGHVMQDFGALLSLSGFFADTTRRPAEVLDRAARNEEATA